MKVLFLDVDGVLNSQAFFQGRKWADHIDRFEIADVRDINTWIKMLDPVAVGLLENFLLASTVEIVISSSWREVHTLPRLKLIFDSAAELPGNSKIAERIIDRTDIGGPREYKILEWVDRFSGEIEAWAVLDDMPLERLNDIAAGQDRHVKTTWADGLQITHIERLKELLK